MASLSIVLILMCKVSSVTSQVPQNAPVAVYIYESKMQTIPAPSCHAHKSMHTDVYTIALPHSDKTVFCPPSSHFLNEGLTTHVRGEEQYSG